MFKKKCFICREKDKKYNMRRKYVRYWDYSMCYYYHLGCLKVASCQPEYYTTSTLNLVIDIINDLKKEKARRTKTLLQCHKNCKEFKGE